MSVYTDNGYKNRRNYLDSLAEEFEVEVEVVYSIANMLGSSEDFDGLVSSLEDYVLYHNE